MTISKLCVRVLLDPNQAHHRFLQGKFDAALRDYNKGKFLLETRPGQLLSASNDVKREDGQPKRILDKVWQQVEKVMAGMRSTLLAKLEDSSRPVEEQERTIESVLHIENHSFLTWWAGSC